MAQENFFCEGGKAAIKTVFQNISMYVLWTYVGFGKNIFQFIFKSCNLSIRYFIKICIAL